MALPDIWRGERSRPTRELSRLQQQIDRVFEDFFSPFSRDMELAMQETRRFVPAVDIEETDKSYILRFDVPGISKDDVHVEMDENRLTVSGERKEDREEDEKGMHRRERYYGSFQRSFVLPESTDSEKVEATFRDGVLRVNIPKSERASKSRKIEVGEEKSAERGSQKSQKKEEKGAA